MENNNPLKKEKGKPTPRRKKAPSESYRTSCMRCRFFGLLCDRKAGGCRACIRAKYTCTYNHVFGTQLLSNSRTRTNYFYLKNYPSLSFRKLNDSLQHRKFLPRITKKKAKTSSDQPNVTIQEVAPMLKKLAEDIIFPFTSQEPIDIDNIIQKIEESEQSENNVPLPSSSLVKAIYETLNQKEAASSSQYYSGAYDDSAAFALAEEYTKYLL
ncbi:hypothetical protein BB560_005815 [Smittium megazygosporum]|uniref:Zn(2)-C6 fungal-type domain-containing protein n=1 Tax=Smittium megazygosporum TaxID=133381 RepID=A0A2T9YVH6_9FUNG|nr:hypothetical protein BB560_005815 [Smittium megazygosporum]